MTNHFVLVLLLAIVIGSSAIFVGNILIDAYFRRKEKFVHYVNNQLKGGQDGTDD